MNLKGGYIQHDLNWAIPENRKVQTGDFVAGSPEAYQLYLAIKSGVPIIINVEKFEFTDTNENTYQVSGVVIPVMAFTTDLGNEIIFISGVSQGGITALNLEITRVVEPSVDNGGVGKATATWATF